MATPTSLPASFSAGNVLTASQMNDLRGAFRILQVVNATTTSDTTSASTTYVSTALAATITPRATTSKIFVVCSVSIYTSADGGEAGLRLLRGSTNVLTNQQVKTGTAGVMYAPFMHYDSPSTTSSTTYTLQVARNAGNGNVTINVNSATSTMTLLEVSL